MSWACFHELIYVLCRMCFLPFVVRIPIPTVPQLIITSILQSVIHISIPHHKQGRVAQSVAPESEVLGSIPVLFTYFFSPSADSRKTVVSYWQKYVHEVLVNRLGGLSLPRTRFRILCRHLEPMTE